jgi:hypothetical protein
MNIQRIKKTIILLLFFQISLAFAQSRKVQIETLKLKVDSLNNLLGNERKIEFIKQQVLNSSLKMLKIQFDSLRVELNKINNRFTQKEQELISIKELSKNKFDAKLNEVNVLKHQLDSLNIVIAELKIINGAIKIKSDSNQIEGLQYRAIRSFNPLDYDFEDSGNFKENYDTIIKKENKRILNSKYAIREFSLKIKLMNSELISLVSISERDNVEETHFAYLFENELRAKLYYVMIHYFAAGPGTKTYTLFEIDLKTGKINTLVSKIGGSFDFNKNETYLLVSGWYDSHAYVKDNQLRVITILNKKIDLILENIEPININWLSDNEFKCQLLNYSTEKEWPFSRIPSKITSKCKKC